MLFVCVFVCARVRPSELAVSTHERLASLVCFEGSVAKLFLIVLEH